MVATPKLTDRVKMIYLIRRRREVSRDELIMHWFKNHMPAVIASQVSAEKSGRDHANKYIAQLFANADQYEGGWDGMAQLWYQNPLPVASTAHGRAPTDTFQEKAEPYNAWATREYVIRDGSDQLPAEPLTLNEPYPSTRTGFYRLNYLVAAKDGTVHEEFFKHWLEVHVPNVDSVLEKTKGIRYVVSHSINPDAAPFAGMAELYFPAEEDALAFQSTIKPDGMERWIDGVNMQILHGDTEMIGIP